MLTKCFNLFFYETKAERINFQNSIINIWISSIVDKHQFIKLLLYNPLQPHQKGNKTKRGLNENLQIKHHPTFAHFYCFLIFGD